MPVSEEHSVIEISGGRLINISMPKGSQEEKGEPTVTLANNIRAKAETNHIARLLVARQANNPRNEVKLKLQYIHQKKGKTTTPVAVGDPSISVSVREDSSHQVQELRSTSPIRSQLPVSIKFKLE